MTRNQRLSKALLRADPSRPAAARTLLAPASFCCFGSSGGAPHCMSTERSKGRPPGAASAPPCRSWGATLQGPPVDWCHGQKRGTEMSSAGFCHFGQGGGEVLPDHYHDHPHYHSHSLPRSTPHSHSIPLALPLPVPLLPLPLHSISTTAPTPLIATRHYNSHSHYHCHSHNPSHYHSHCNSQSQ